MIVDLSEYNTITNWDALKKSVDGIILRCAYRGYGSSGKVVADKKFMEYAKGCKSHGIPFGIYFFSQAINAVEAQAEADYIVKAAKEYAPELPLYIDSEYGNTSHTGRADNLSKEVRTQVIEAFCNTVNLSGYTAGVYASESWFNNQLYYNRVKGFNVWVANYGKNNGVNNVSIKLSKWDLHQYTSNGTINGVNGRVDLSDANSALISPKSSDISTDSASAVSTKVNVSVSLPVLKRGVKNNAVKLWQMIIGADVDGSFGPATETLTKSWQSKHGLDADGKVGKNTWSKALSLL